MSLLITILFLLAAYEAYKHRANLAELKASAKKDLAELEFCVAAERSHVRDRIKAIESHLGIPTPP